MKQATGEGEGCESGRDSLERSVVTSPCGVFINKGTRLHAEGDVADTNSAIVVFEMVGLVQEVVVQKEECFEASEFVVHDFELNSRIEVVGGRNRAHLGGANARAPQKMPC